MRRTWWLPLLLLVALSPSRTAAEDLVTEYTLLTGSAAPDENGGTVVIVPGTVVPEPETERYTASVLDVRDKLKATYRLGSLEVTEQEARTLAVGAPTAMPVPAGDLTVTVTLLGREGDTVAYRVRFEESGELLAEPAVKVRIGGRVIVATRDGSSAPYAFVLLSPRRPEPRAGADVAAPPIAVTRPELVHKVRPAYPERARRTHAQGAVVLQVRVGPDGRVTAVRVLRSAGSDLDEAAVDAVRQWRYEPSRDADGRPVSVTTIVTIRFALD